MAGNERGDMDKCGRGVEREETYVYLVRESISLGVKYPL